MDDEAGVAAPGGEPLVELAPQGAGADGQHVGRFEVRKRSHRAQEGGATASEEGLVHVSVIHQTQHVVTAVDLGGVEDVATVTSGADVTRRLPSGTSGRCPACRSQWAPAPDGRPGSAGLTRRPRAREG